MKTKLIFGTLLLALSSCVSSGVKTTQTERTTEPEVRRQLQGVWIDRNTESPVLTIQGDSICYASKSDVQMAYKLLGDTLFVTGLHTSAYPVIQRTEHSLSFKTPMGDVMSLYKTDNENFVIPQQPVEKEPENVEKIKKDSVIMHGNTRYRGYVYINPTTMKVIRPGVTEDGFSIDNVYYDNIIHICVYDGKKRLCGKDIKKQHFHGIVPEEFIEMSILEDMDFVKVTNEGFVYRATLCVPDGPCYYIHVILDKESNVNFELIQ